MNDVYVLQIDHYVDSKLDYSDVDGFFKTKELAESWLIDNGYVAQWCSSNHQENALKYYTLENEDVNIFIIKLENKGDL